MKLINIGFGNLVSSDKIVAVVAPDSAPVKRIVQDAKQNNLLIDATCGRKCKSVIVAENNHVILSAISCEAIQNRTDESADFRFLTNIPTFSVYSFFRLQWSLLKDDFAEEVQRMKKLFGKGLHRLPRKSATRTDISTMW